MINFTVSLDDDAAQPLTWLIRPGAAVYLLGCLIFLSF